MIPKQCKKDILENETSNLMALNMCRKRLHDSGGVNIILLALKMFILHTNTQSWRKNTKKLEREQEITKKLK